MQTLLNLLGYAKIPKAAVQLSIAQENFFRDAVKAANKSSDLLKKHLKKRLEIQKTLTDFLRSGRLMRK